MMAYILYDPNLLTTLRAEISPAVSEATAGLELRLERLPQLEAVYHEVLRLHSSASTVRTVLSDTELRDKILPKGTNILIPYRQLHLDDKVFGENAKEFDAERFLKIKNLSQSPSFKPFGAGSTYCPGRFLARREILTFVALAISRFDISVSDPKAGGSCPMFPRVDKKKFGLGVMNAVKGDDITVNLKARAT